MSSAITYRRATALDIPAAASILTLSFQLECLQNAIDYSPSYLSAYWLDAGRLAATGLSFVAVDTSADDAVVGVVLLEVDDGPTTTSAEPTEDTVRDEGLEGAAEGGGLQGKLVFQECDPIELLLRSVRSIFHSRLSSVQSSVPAPPAAAAAVVHRVTFLAVHPSFGRRGIAAGLLGAALSGGGGRNDDDNDGGRGHQADVLYAECSGSGSRAACVKCGFDFWGMVKYDEFRARYEVLREQEGHERYPRVFNAILDEEGVALMVWHRKKNVEEESR